MPRQSLHVTVEKDRPLSYIGVVTQHRLTIGFHLILLLVALSSAHSQDVSISLSPQIDTLSSRLLRNPDDRALQLRLIDAYTLSFNPELALLELLNAEGQGKLIREDVGIKREPREHRERDQDGEHVVVGDERLESGTGSRL